MRVVFEDDEAVIKMTIKGRIPTMRHVSRTLDRINLDSKIQIRYIDTKRRPEAISHVTNGTIFFICSTSAVSALLAALGIPA